MDLDESYPHGYSEPVYRLRQTEVFARWLGRLRDARARARILVRLESARLGNLGDSKSVGGGVREMRVHVGPGYRLYFTQRGETCCCCSAGVTSRARLGTFSEPGGC